MSDVTGRPDEYMFAGDDAVVPFQVEALDARGRAVQLGPTLDDILSRHAYPEPVAKLLAEAIVLTVLLGTSLKFEGKFIFQSQSNGPVDMLVVDFSTPNAVRAYARFDEERLADAIEQKATAPAELLGSGTLALTVDQGEYTQRYQGIVALDGSNLEEIAKTYFRQSEQIPTDLRLSVAKLIERGEDGRPVEQWRAGGLIVQFLPESELRMRQPDLSAGDVPESALDDMSEFREDDDWAEIKALVSTIESSELTDPQVGAERLLYRLFHERGVRVFDAVPVSDECSCSREKIAGVLSGFTAEEIDDSIEDGKISVTCEFCSTLYEFDPAEFRPRN
ncbi:Hsp33 family molecular chaperone [Phyllobacterium sp. 0TCS1.6C]|jgi:molecular chaperone Hsp33|uniref:Hsp33 family molecular chaperone n=1 Tax=unclassified Phyllobacterium TaxID=2638441 RepID=UPI0022655E2D|nr:MULTISPECIES: Hsp33 family molecular chaperone [unclassified Phyllobacterium]MCX8281937.1 Hsp33 family molecular chaperone [Phyllobacterium sp. 0TCS1.6C]MCX8294400.1 Hsp33 family molecular chaperone [Phyllobacterium sp. 0TCS1.6A]